MQTLKSACPLDCPDACSLEVRIEEGRITSIDGSRVNPLTEGYICAKVRRFADHVYSADRLLSPGLRDGPKGEGRFRKASWDEALSLVAERMATVRRSAGGEGILPFSYGGSNGLLSQDTTDARLFHRLGASRLARTVCAAPSRAAAGALYGRMPGVALQDYLHAKLIVVWGTNPSVSGIHLVPILRKARERGAKLVVVDPRRTPVAQGADLHLALRPGTDLPVALSLIRWLFAHDRADLPFLSAHATGTEELRRRVEPWTPERAGSIAGLEAGQIESLARLYAETSPAAIRCGWGPERNRNGGSAIAAILALPAVAGKFGVRGGGYTMSNSGAWKLDSLAAAGEAPPRTREINMNLLGDVLLGKAEPPVSLLFVYNANPLATLPCQEKVRAGLAREDLFTVVFDQVLTDTARFADIVLPATTFLERTELSRGYGAMVLQEAKAVIAPVGESRSNHEVFAELCRRTGVARPEEPETADELSATILNADRRGADLRTDLDASGIAIPETGFAPVQFVDSFPLTPDRKIRLCPEDLDREAPGGLYAYREDPATDRFPLALISPATGRTISSTLGQLRRKPARLDLSPADAAARRITDGDEVRVYNSGGEVRCLVRVSPDVRPGVACLPKGLWSHGTLNGRTANALVPDTLTDLGGGACFNDARVEVERVGAGAS
ncbi:MAG TPA: molybdopterin-dependent oxidoreductase [Candidatus Polarisedimenticolia bacterium]|nr:molybdopterin-dependent oxidoreductase [Candidatus Polarisedimenticolia bacterium]